MTHHKEIFQENLVNENYLVRFFTMEAVIQNDDQYYSFIKDLTQLQNKNPNHKYVNMKEGLKIAKIADHDKVIFIYKVKPGFSVNSFAIFCAKQIGFEKELLARINEIQIAPQDEIRQNPLATKKHEDTVRDLLFRINDFLCSVHNE